MPSLVNNWFKSAAFNQEEWEYSFSDYQRWIIDAYEVKAFLTETDRKWVVSMHVFNKNNGGMVYQQFWRYSLNESEKAKKSFTKLKEILGEVVERFTSGYEEASPNNLINSHIRAMTWELDRDHLAITNIPNFNYSAWYGSYEGDWRSNIYGKRYPDSTDGL